MAITKLTRTDANEEQFVADLIEALKPYFTSVTRYEDNINCTVMVGAEEKTFLSLNLRNEMTFTLSCTYYLDGSAKYINQKYSINGYNTKLNEVYVCSNGIMFGVYCDNGSQYQPIHGLTRDNNGNTVVIIPTYGFDSSNTPNSVPNWSFQSINKNSAPLGGDLVFVQNVIYPSTSLSNIPVNDVGAYCPNAFKYDCKEYGLWSDRIRKVTHEGVDYLTNGFWCIKDGGVANE